MLLFLISLLLQSLHIYCNLLQKQIKITVSWKITAKLYLNIENQIYSTHTGTTVPVPIVSGIYKLQHIPECSAFSKFCFSSTFFFITVSVKTALRIKSFQEHRSQILTAVDKKVLNVTESRQYRKTKFYSGVTKQCFKKRKYKINMKNLPVRCFMMKIDLLRKVRNSHGLSYQK